MPKRTKTPPSDDAIHDEIANLRDLMDLIPPVTAFGDSNLDGIDTQIEVLENLWSEDELYDAYPPDEDDENENRVNHGLEAVHWLEGDESEAPSKQWAPLIRNT